jgi:hypothetical protein
MIRCDPPHLCHWAGDNLASRPRTPFLSEQQSFGPGLLLERLWVCRPVMFAASVPQIPC